MNSQNYFEILGISENATQQEINSAYLKLIKSSKTNKSINTYLINEAYNVLKHPLERYHYICALHMNEKQENAIDDLYNKKQYNKLIIEDGDDSFIDIVNKQIKPIECKEDKINFDNNLEKLKAEREKQIQDIDKEIKQQYGGKPDESIFNNIHNNQDINNMMFNNDKGLISAFNEEDEDTGYTLLDEIEQVSNANKMFDTNRSKMEAAIKSGNIDEFMRLRAEEKKIITKY